MTVAVWGLYFISKILAHYSIYRCQLLIYSESQPCSRLFPTHKDIISNPLEQFLIILEIYLVILHIHTFPASRWSNVRTMNLRSDPRQQHMHEPTHDIIAP